MDFKLAYHTILHTLAISISAVALIDFSVWALRDTREPIIISKVETLNSPLTEGESLLVRVFREKFRDCPLNSERYVQNLDGKSFNIPDVVGRGGPIGTPYVDVAYDTSSLVPDAYTLFVHLIYLCEDEPHIVNQPPVQFRIVAKETGNG